MHDAPVVSPLVQSDGREMYFEVRLISRQGVLANESKKHT